MNSPKDRDPLEELTKEVVEHSGQFASYARSVLRSRGGDGSHEQVEEVLSDAYLTAATKLKTSESVRIRNYQAWFQTILFLHCLRETYGRRGQQWKEYLEELETENEAFQLFAEGLETEAKLEHQILVKQVLQSLNQKDQEIITLGCEGFTSGEIAAAVGGTADSVRQARSRARRRLRKMFQGQL